MGDGDVQHSTRSKTLKMQDGTPPYKTFAASADVYQINTTHIYTYKLYIVGGYTSAQPYHTKVLLLATVYLVMTSSHKNRIKNI